MRIFFTKPLLLALLMMSLLIPALTGCGNNQREEEAAGLQDQPYTIADPTSGIGASHLPSPIIYVVLVTLG